MSDETVETAEAVPAADQRLSEPSEELVRHAVRTLDWDARLSVTKMSAGVGNSTVEVYSFPELVNVLFGVQWDRLEGDGTKASIVWVDAAKLAAWLRDVLGDTEFADAVEQSLEGVDHYKAQIEAMFPLFKQRVAQYQAILNADESARDEDGA